MEKTLVFQSMLKNPPFNGWWNATDIKDGKSVIIKRMEKSKIFDEDVSSLKLEVERLDTTSHPCIPRIISLVEDDSAYCIVMDSPKGILLDRFVRSGPLGEDVIRKLLCELVHIAKYLLSHSPSIFPHLTSDVIFVNKSGALEQIYYSPLDSIIIEHFQSTISRFTAPETITGQQKSEKCVTWCIGVIAYLMAVGKFPFAPSTENTHDIQKSVLNEHPELPDFLSDDLRDLLKRSLVKNPVMRMSLQALQDHPFLTAGEYLDHEIAELPRKDETILPRRMSSESRKRERCQSLRRSSFDMANSKLFLTPRRDISYLALHGVRKSSSFAVDKC